MADLDARQTAAVATGPTDLFVAAGAGSGKTRMLTARFVAAVLGSEPYVGCDPRDVLAVTFTERAAAELSERIRGELIAAGEASAARSLTDAWITTIHGMCARVVRQNAFAAGVEPHFRVLDDVEASALEAQAVEEATAEMLSSNAESSALFDDYGYDVIVDAALRIRAAVRALGISSDDVVTVGIEEALGVLATCKDSLRLLGEQLAGLPQTKTVETNAEIVRSLADVLGDCDPVTEANAYALLERLNPRGLRRASAVDGLNELVDEVTIKVAEARRAAAQLLVGRYERLLLDFLGRIESRDAALKRERGALDFSDLELETVRLLEDHPGVRERYRKRFAMLMVDEYQDTNALQSRIIGALSARNLCTVGDENQSIYGFRHADVEVFRARAMDVADRRDLDINYRTSPVLLNTVNEMFRHQSLIGPELMVLQPSPARAGDPDAWAGGSRFEARFVDWSRLQGADRQDVEAAVIADRVAELVATGVGPGQVAVLMRALSGGRGAKVERELTARGIPAYLSSGGTFFDAPEVLEARALLAVIDNVRDDAAMTVVLAGRLGGLSPDALVVVREHADRLAGEASKRRTESCLFDALSDPVLKLAPCESDAARRIVHTIETARARRGIRSLRDCVLEPMLGLDADLVCFAGGPGGARAWSNVLKLADMAGEFEALYGGDVRGFLAYLDMREIHGGGEQEATLDGEYDAVRIMSIHAAKGLEFPAVVVGGLGVSHHAPGIGVARVEGSALLGMVQPMPDGSEPTTASSRVGEAIRAAAEAESARLLYVACTRAEESLTIVAFTNPEKEAEPTLPGRIRDALGAGPAGSLTADAPASAGGAGVVRLVEPAARGVKLSTTGESLVESLGDGASNGTGPASGVVVRGPGAPGRVSYTGLATYDRCPYRFFLTSVAKLPAPPAAQQGEALSFGSALHAVLECLTSPQDDLSAVVSRIAALAGLSAASAERLSVAVSTFQRSAVAAELLGSQRVLREAQIMVPIGDTVLVGAIDAIGWRGSSALVVDYKTGTSALSAEEALDRYRLQGECYALAAVGAGAEQVRVVFAELERGRETEYEYSAADRDALQASVRDIVDSMAPSGYPVRETYEQDLCETCPGLGSVCPITRPTGGGAG